MIRILAHIACFNPRLRAGGDVPFSVKIIWNRSFNPRLRAGGDLILNGGQHGRDSFNPRLRAGGDGELEAMQEINAVSIHASAREATLVYSRNIRSNNVSIHASAREATYQGHLQKPMKHCFNPRLRAGGDI